MNACSKFTIQRRFHVSLFSVLAFVVFESASSLAQTISATVDVSQGDLSSRTGEDWPRLLGKDGSSHSSEVGIQTDWSKGLPIVWTAGTGVGYSNGVTFEGRYFQFDRFGDFERLTCYVAETGESLWSDETPVEYEDAYGYNNGTRASPVVAKDNTQQTVVLTLGVTGRLIARKAINGDKLWEVNTNAAYSVEQNFFGVAASPFVWGEDVWVMVGGSTRARAVETPNGTGMVCFDLQTGREKAKVGNYLSSYSTPIKAEFDGKHFLLSLVREGLLVIDLESRTEVDFAFWRAESFESVNAASPVLIGDEILISETYGPGSASFRLKNGKLEKTWQDVDSRKDKLLRAHWATPVVAGNFVFACSGRNAPDSDFRCLDWSTKSVKWFDRNLKRTTVLSVDGHLIVLGEYGQLWLLKANTDKVEIVGKIDLEKMQDPKGQSLVSYPAWAPPILSRGLLYVRGPQNIVCLELIPKASP